MADVVDENVDPAERPVALGEQGNDLGVVADIGVNASRPSGPSRQIAATVRSSPSWLMSHAEDIRSMSGHPEGDPFADPGRGAGNDRHPAAQIEQLWMRWYESISHLERLPHASLAP